MSIRNLTGQSVLAFHASEPWDAFGQLADWLAENLHRNCDVATVQYHDDGSCEVVAIVVDAP